LKDYITTIGKIAFELVNRKPGIVILINTAAFIVILYGIFIFIPKHQDEQIRNYDLWQKKHWYEDEGEVIATEETLFKAITRLTLTHQDPLSDEVAKSYAEVIAIRKKLARKKIKIEEELEKSSPRGEDKEE
jgi:hypothetical protein